MDKEGERVLSLCGTTLCHEKLEYCDQCGAVVGPARYLDYVKKRTSTIMEAFEGRQFCEKCAADDGGIQVGHHHHLVKEEEGHVSLSPRGQSQGLSKVPRPRWEEYMNQYVGYRGVVTDPDMVINDPEALVQVTLEGTGGTHRFPQDCLKKL